MVIVTFHTFSRHTIHSHITHLAACVLTIPLMCNKGYMVTHNTFSRHTMQIHSYVRHLADTPVNYLREYVWAVHFTKWKDFPASPLIPEGGPFPCPLSSQGLLVLSILHHGLCPSFSYSIRTWFYSTCSSVKKKKCLRLCIVTDRFPF